MFQSTHSLRSATDDGGLCVVVARVSIHALLAECDPCHPWNDEWQEKFQSTHSLRSATQTPGLFLPHQEFQSTHSLRSATHQRDRRAVHGTRFNPRTPCGVRLNFDGSMEKYEQFQSTHSLRSATNIMQLGRYLNSVSIHALLAECDLGETKRYCGAQSFNPRTPCGVRLFTTHGKNMLRWFQSTHSLRSATC